MTIRRPSWGLVLITAVSVALFFGLAAWGYGSWAGLVADPARASGLAVIGLAAFASLFSGIHLGGCSRPDAAGRWRLIPLALLSLAIAALPPWADRRDWLTWGGEPARYLGLACLALGAWLRVGPMFRLGDRFTWPLASQPGHALLTDGMYRWVRHPSYAGAWLGALGWALLFRSGVGLALAASLFPGFDPIIRAEEESLRAEFGPAYDAYRQQTWRLIPGIY